MIVTIESLALQPLSIHILYPVPTKTVLEGVEFFAAVYVLVHIQGLECTIEKS